MFFSSVEALQLSMFRDGEHFFFHLLREKNGFTASIINITDFYYLFLKMRFLLTFLLATSDFDYFDPYKN